MNGSAVVTDHHRLEVREVSKTYGAVRALDSVSFSLFPGEVMALLGENGAGKSTIVKILSGLVVADEGEVLVDGTTADVSLSKKAQAAGIAVVQQEYSLVGTLTVAENLALGHQDSGMIWGRRRLRREASALLAQVGLEHIDPRRHVETLTVAEMQLLEIARVLARHARIVVFDEPTAALSDAEIVRVLEVVRRMAAQGISVIYVTHRLPEVFEIADRITIFRNGRSYPPIEVGSTSVDEVVTMMLGRDLGDLYPPASQSYGPVRLELAALSVRGLREPVTLTVRQGEILGLTGQIGSGVENLMHALGGLGVVVDGEVLLDGEPVDLRGRGNGIRHGIAYCSADRKKDGIFAGLSIQRNLSSPWLRETARWGFMSPRRERRLASEIAERFAIDTRRLESSVGVLSGGNQQKVAFGKWLGIHPRVLLVEEPTRGVDVGARADIYRELRALCDEGLTVIVSSSDTAEIFGLADTIATFYHSQLSEIRSREEWTIEGIVREVMHRSVAS